MTVRALALAACIIVIAAGSALAQPPAIADPKAPPRSNKPTPAAVSKPAPVARREGQPVNIKVDFTLTDQRTGGAAVKRTVSVVVADGRTGQIRSQADVFGIPGSVPLNIDTAPELLPDGKIRLGFALQYRLAGAARPNRSESAATRDVDENRHARQRHADCRERQGDDRRAVGRPDRRSSGHRRSEGNSP